MFASGNMLVSIDGFAITIAIVALISITIGYGIGYLSAKE